MTAGLPSVGEKTGLSSAFVLRESQGLPRRESLELPRIIRVEFDLVGPVIRSTGEEVTRRDPDRPVGYRIGSGDRVQDLWASDRYGVTILCRAPKAHRLCTIYRHAGDPDLLSYTVKAGLVVVEPALWISPLRKPLKVTRFGVPPKALTIEHVCGTATDLRIVPMRVDLGRVQEMLDQMRRAGLVEIRAVRW